MADLIGQKIGNYVLHEYLGGGGSGQVYRGEHIYLKTQAAIKFLHRVTPKDMDKFIKEAQTIAALKDHQHILRVLEFGVDRETPYLVMDYAPQGTLRRRHPYGSVLPLPRILSYVKPIASALEYAHERKVIHRDIKPENILIGDQQSLLLSDFGIAAIAHTTKSMHTMDVTGTPYYMPPEQFRGRPCAASDQYALGIVVYEWATGQRPFDGESVFDIAVQHINEPVPPLTGKNQNIPLAVEEVVLTALAKQPKGRFATVSAFARALEQACQDTFAPQPRASTPPPVRVTELPSIVPAPFSNQASEAVQPSVNSSASSARQKADAQAEPNEKKKSDLRPPSSTRVIPTNLTPASAVAVAVDQPPQLEKPIDTHDRAEQSGAHELQQTLQAILSIANPDHRQVLLYTYVAGLDEQKVAELLQLHTQDFKSLREEALRNLKTKPEIMELLRSLPN